MKSADLETYFSKEGTNDLCVCAACPKSGKMQNKPIMTYHEFERLLQTNNINNNKKIGGAEKHQSFNVTAETINWYRHERRQHERS